MKFIVMILLLFSCSKDLDKGRKISSTDYVRKTIFLDPDAAEKIRKVDWKKTFAEIFSKHIIQDDFKSPIPYPPHLKIKESVYYNEKPFEEIYLKILKEPTSHGVVRMREKILSDDRILENLNKRGLSERHFYRTAAHDFLETLEQELQADKKPIGNYFETSLGKIMMETLKDTVFIILPGFGNHLIQEMVLPDLIEDINEHYGRARTRPFTEGGFNPGFIDYREYYGNPKRPIQFDIIQPMGKDTGTTFTTHQEIAKSLKIWIENLPEFYIDKEIVFIGYSKGATLATQIVTDFPEIRDRTKAIFSLGGALQGSNLAEFLSKNIYGIGNSPELEELRKKINESPGNIEFDEIIKLMAKNAFNENLFFKNLINNIPILPENYRGSIKDFFERVFAEDTRVLLEGLFEEGTSHMLDWNLKYLNQDYFDRPIALFNLSFLSNYKDFLIRGPIGDDGAKLPPEIVPQFSKEGINTKSFSLDMLSQILISINNQEKIPGGLTDSMVSWNNSKFPIFDPLPLNETYTPEVLTEAYKKNYFFKENFSFEDFISKPRKEIFLKRGTENMFFIDLGEVRGTHWSTMFRQVVRLPGVDESLSHSHSFPHKAMFKTIIETYGIYKLIRD